MRRRCFGGVVRVGWVVFATTLTLLTTSARGQERKVDFRNQVLPVIGRYCFDCHGDPAPKKRAKGGLRLDGRAWFTKGGDTGKILVAKKPSESPLYERIALPADHEDVMPPRTPRPSRDEIGRIRRWIKEGADFGSWKGRAGPKKSGAGDARSKEESTKPTSRWETTWQRLAEGLRPATTQALARARGKHAKITPIAKNSPLLRVTYRSYEGVVTNADIQLLLAIRQNVTAIDVRRCTKLDDKALVPCGQMPRLTRLDVSRTSITDRGLARLTLLDELRYLNLFGTKISDGGLETLGRLPALDAVYLWQTRSSKVGARRLERVLKKRHPHARVVREPGLPKPPRRR